jgi:uncharacterized protein (DUF697 family)
MDKSEQECVIAIALLAAFADGVKDEAEHAAIRRVAEGFKLELVDMAGLYQQVITGQLTVQQAVAGLASPQAKNLAYEVARCICEADNVTNPAEEQFLAELTAAIKPSAKLDATINGQSPTTASQPASSVQGELSVIGPITDPQQPLDPLLIKYSVLTAALELLPQTAGALAILPIQLKMVYDLSRRNGVKLDQQSVKDFGAAFGVGAAGQIIEAGLRRLVSNVLGSVGSSMGSVSSGVAGTALTFATTYALGLVADKYYASGRKIDVSELKTEFSNLVEKAKATQAQYTDEITVKAKQLSEQLKSNSLGSMLGDLIQGKF